MSPTNKSSVSKFIGWSVAGFLLVASTWIWFERQWVIDTLQYFQYTPSSQVEKITSELGLTESSKFMFYASNPSVETSKTFNIYCKRQEANSPILGCYANMRIHIYGITDERLNGIQEVTAAHELLHAQYDRLSSAKKQQLEPLLEKAYQRLADDELKKRMEYYDRTQPGEKYNELHSILPTEFADIGQDLEDYYRQYFSNRQKIVRLHTHVASQFAQLSEEANQLVEKINTLTVTINSNTERYNAGVAQLNQKVTVFNARADQPGGFSSQAEFNAERAALEAERAQLDALRAQVSADTATHKQLVAQLDAINAKAESLNKSIDSVLTAEPEI
mgnify:CR=1 FL=1